MSKSFEDMDAENMYRLHAMAQATGRSIDSIREDDRSLERHTFAIRHAHPVRSHMHSSDADYYLQPGTDIVRPIDDIFR